MLYESIEGLVCLIEICATDGVAPGADVFFFFIFFILFMKILM